MPGGILIVDDNASIRHLLRVLIESKTSFKVCGEAENGEQAIRITRDLQPALVLLDLTMPGMSGTQTATVLRLMEPRPKIILFTLHADGVNRELLSIYGIDAVISKPDSIALLVPQIEKLLTPPVAPPVASPDAQPYPPKRVN